MKYRKKADTIEAVQVTRYNANDIVSLVSQADEGWGVLFVTPTEDDSCENQKEQIIVEIVTPGGKHLVVRYEDYLVLTDGMIEVYTKKGFEKRFEQEPCCSPCWYPWYPTVTINPPDYYTIWPYTWSGTSTSTAGTTTLAGCNVVTSLAGSNFG